MNTTSPPERAADVLALLRSLKNDRGAMANLRCALVPARRHRAWPLLARVGGIDDPIAETVAALYAYHPEETTDGNLGDTCRQLAGTHNSFDGRFRRLRVRSVRMGHFRARGLARIQHEHPGYRADRAVSEKGY